MDTVKQSCQVLDRILRQGGVIDESALPYDNDLLMYRLTQRKFIRPTATYDSGERIFAITDKGIAELERNPSHTGN
jgi:hypothetical protein